jgi:hypothetical protein
MDENIFRTKLIRYIFQDTENINLVFFSQFVMEKFAENI